MKKSTIAFLLILTLFSSHLSKKLTILAEEDDSIIIKTSFEDGDTSMFTPRGEGDTSVFVVKTDGGKTGDSYLAVTEREKNWNGAQYDLGKKCTPGGQYLVSAWLKTPWYCNICLSMQYTDGSGEAHYNNLKCVVSQGDWVEIKEYKFSMPSGCTDVFLYFENTSGNNDFYIDDFELKKAPEGKIQENISSLKDVYKKYFKVGTATTVAEISPKTTQKINFKTF